MSVSKVGPEESIYSLFCSDSKGLSFFIGIVKRISNHLNDYLTRFPYEYTMVRPTSHISNKGGTYIPHKILIQLFIPLYGVSNTRYYTNQLGRKFLNQ